MSFFDAFYFVSYTATTIGFGELPYPFTDRQRMWVTVSIYLSVIGWAYASASLLGAAAGPRVPVGGGAARFGARCARLREPFELIAGSARPASCWGTAFDALGQRFVVLDVSDERIEAPGTRPRRPRHRSPAWPPTPSTRDSGVAGPRPRRRARPASALTTDDEANLAIAMAAGLLRPEHAGDRPVTSPGDRRAHAGLRQPEHGQPVRPLRRSPALALRSPASYQLLTWLEAGPGAELPGARLAARTRPLGRLRLRPARPGADRRPARRGLDVTVIEPRRRTSSDADLLVGDGSDPWSWLGRDRPRGRTRRRHGQRHDQPVPRRCGPARRTRGSSSPRGRTGRRVRRCSPRWTSTPCSCPRN